MELQLGQSLFFRLKFWTGVLLFEEEQRNVFDIFDQELTIDAF